MRLSAVIILSTFLFACHSGTDPEADAGQLDSGQPPQDAGTCEGIDLQTNPNHCGACNRACSYRPSAFASCAMGVCQYACLPGAGDCDHDLALTSGNGCEVQLATNPSHCGACGATCTNTRPNAVAACSAGMCGVRCESTHGDCNGDLTSAAGNGCETDLRTAAANCGECFKACSTSCTAGACAGELAECRLFAAQSPRPSTFAMASDGTNSAAAWWDADNKGLWVALLGPHGQTVVAPRRILDAPAAARPALAFDGTSFVLASSTSTLNGLSLQRLSRAALADEGTVVQLGLSTSPPMVYGASSAGRAAFMGWNTTLQSVHVVIWRQGASQPDAPRVVNLPGTPDSAATGFAAVRDGYVVAWVAQKPSAVAGLPPEKRLGTLRLGLDGAPGGSAIDATPSSLSLQNGLSLASMGDRALLVAVEGGLVRLRSLVIDEIGAPAGTGDQFAWNVLVSNFEGSASVGGDASGAWLLELGWTNGIRELRFRRLSAAGQTAGLPKRITSIVGQPDLQVTSITAGGAMALWRRSMFAVADSVLGTAYVDVNGQVNTVCVAP